MESAFRLKQETKKKRLWYACHHALCTTKTILKLFREATFLCIHGWQYNCHLAEAIYIESASMRNKILFKKPPSLK